MDTLVTVYCRMRNVHYANSKANPLVATGRPFKCVDVITWKILIYISLCVIFIISQLAIHFTNEYVVINIYAANVLCRLPIALT